MGNLSMITTIAFLYITLVYGSILPYSSAADPKLNDQKQLDSSQQQSTTQTPVGRASVRNRDPFTLPPNNKVQVLAIKVGGMFDKAVPKTKILVNDKILILISNPKVLLALRPSDRSQLILYADQLPLTGINTTYFTSFSKNDLNDNQRNWPINVWIPFVFSRDSTNTAAWNTLFRVTRWNNNESQFHLSLGWEGMFPIEYGTKRLEQTMFRLQLYSTRIFWFVLGGYMAFLIFFIWLCKTTGLIREPDELPSGLGPFSLAQTQLAFWTVIIVGGFLYLTILTGLPNSLNDSSLLLLGITGGTTGVASFIDYFKKGIRTTTMAQGGYGNNSGFVKPKRGFLVDISSDGVNLNMQRAQTIMWNFVLGIYFIWYVITNKAMPEFSNTLLTLAGVSSLVYLSSKGPEKPTLPETNTK
jgi:hypothetical protein